MQAAMQEETAIKRHPPCSCAPQSKSSFPEIIAEDSVSRMAAHYLGIHWIWGVQINGSKISPRSQSIINACRGTGACTLLN